MARLRMWSSFWGWSAEPAVILRPTCTSRLFTFCSQRSRQVNHGSFQQHRYRPLDSILMEHYSRLRWVVWAHSQSLTVRWHWQFNADQPIHFSFFLTDINQLPVACTKVSESQLLIKVDETSWFRPTSGRIDDTDGFCIILAGFVLSSELKCL